MQILAEAIYLNLIYLEYFIQVVKSGSISKAADVLLLKQSNLSKYIKALETEFGTTLFDRNCNGCTLTENGNKVYLWAKKLLEEKDSLMKSFSNTERNNPYTGTLFFYLNPTINSENHTKVLLDFHEKYPKININVIEKNIYSMITELTNRTDSFALSILDKYYIDYLKTNTLLHLLPIHRAKLLLYTAPNSPFLKNQKTISLSTLSRLPLLVYTSAEGESPIIDFLSHYTELNISQKVNNIALFHSMLQTGQYIAVGIDSSRRMDGYHALPIRDGIELSSFFLVSEDNLNNPLIKFFLEFYYEHKHISFPTRLIQD